MHVWTPEKPDSRMNLWRCFLCIWIFRNKMLLFARTIGICRPRKKLITLQIELRVFFFVDTHFLCSIELSVPYKCMVIGSEAFKTPGKWFCFFLSFNLHTRNGLVAWNVYRWSYKFLKSWQNRDFVKNFFSLIRLLTEPASNGKSWDV